MKLQLESEKKLLNLDFTQIWNSAQVYGVRVLLQLPPKE